MTLVPVGHADSALGPEGEGNAESGRRLATYIAHIDALLRRWDAWDARTAEHDPDAGVDQRGAAPPPPPALTREALLEFRGMLVEELEHLDPKP